MDVVQRMEGLMGRCAERRVPILRGKRKLLCRRPTTYNEEKDELGGHHAARVLLLLVLFLLSGGGQDRNRESTSLGACHSVVAIASRGPPGPDVYAWGTGRHPSGVGECRLHGRTCPAP